VRCDRKEIEVFTDTACRISHPFPSWNRRENRIILASYKIDRICCCVTSPRCAQIAHLISSLLDILYSFDPYPFDRISATEDIRLFLYFNLNNCEKLIQRKQESKRTLNLWLLRMHICVWRVSVKFCFHEYESCRYLRPVLIRLRFLATAINKILVTLAIYFPTLRESLSSTMIVIVAVTKCYSCSIYSHEIRSDQKLSVYK